MVINNNLQPKNVVAKAATAAMVPIPLQRIEAHTHSQYGLPSSINGTSLIRETQPIVAETSNSE